MQGLLAVVAILLLAVAVFAFQNPDAVTVRFLYWQMSASVAVVTIAAAATGALAAALASLAARFVKWTRRPPTPTRPGPPPVTPPPVAPPPSRL
ncbi:MAG TPA: lipopolysaccharide assembly protein LapA domain-containing protein [Methylomirabilota bacterium]|jgi:uncharacterized integral membrane protein|nr:lipopolysaccharide assembly protein LapA domain-containing protein [Methylomirabilota bacterium]